MKLTVVAAALVVGVVAGSAGTAWSQGDRSLPVAGYSAARDVPAAKERPDPKMDYKVNLQLRGYVRIGG